MATPGLASRAGTVARVVIGSVMAYWIAMDCIGIGADPDCRVYLEYPAQVPDRGQAPAVPTRRGSGRARRLPRSAWPRPVSTAQPDGVENAASAGGAAGDRHRAGRYLRRGRLPADGRTRSGILVEDGQAHAWLSDDEHRVVLQLESKLRIGSLDMYLRTMRLAEEVAQWGDRTRCGGPRDVRPSRRRHASTLRERA